MVSQLRMRRLCRAKAGLVKQRTYEACQTKRGGRWLMKCILLWTGQAVGNKGGSERARARLWPKPRPHAAHNGNNGAQQYDRTLLRTIVLCTLGLQHGYWKRGLRRYSTQHWLSARQPASESIPRERELGLAIRGVCSQLQFRLGCKEADISVFSARLSTQRFVVVSSICCVQNHTS